jgi:voltage-gated potassium channel
VADDLAMDLHDAILPGRQARQPLGTGAGLLATLRAVSVRTTRFYEVAGVSLMSLAAYYLMPLNGPWAGLLVTGLVLAAAIGLIPLTFRRVRQILVTEQPVSEALGAIATIVTLLVLAFASLYFVIGTEVDGQINGIRTKTDALYFTVTTLSTVGFGDITAIGQGARALVTANMLANLVVLAFSVRLVSWALQQRSQDVRARHGPKA